MIVDQKQKLIHSLTSQKYTYILFPREKRSARMCSFGRRVWVLIMVVFLSSAKNAMSLELHVQVTNSLDEKIDLSVDCNHFDSRQRIIAPNTSYKWDYFGDLPSSQTPFLCAFRWGSASSTFNLATLFDSDCKKFCQWFIKESGPCKYYETKEVCFKWLPPLAKAHPRLV